MEIRYFQVTEPFMLNELRTLRNELRATNDQARHLSGPLRASARGLRSPGFSSNSSLITELRSLASRLESLDQKVHDVGSRIFGAIKKRDAAPTTLESLRESVTRLRRMGVGKVSQSRRRLAAMRVCNFILRLRTTDNTYLAELAKCQAEAADWKQWLEASSEASAAPQNSDFLSGQHPLFAMAQLIEHADRLSDETWTTLLTQVEQHFGRGLGTAISRQRLASA